MEKEVTREEYTLKEDESTGKVSIADDVVALIASIAATEVDGVSSLVGNVTNEIMSRVGMKKIAKGVKVNVNDGKVVGELAIMINYGYNIPATCKNVQDRVKNTIENMTGLEVVNVNIRIGGINVNDK